MARSKRRFPKGSELATSDAGARALAARVEALEPKPPSIGQGVGQVRRERKIEALKKRIQAVPDAATRDALSLLLELQGV